jgi:hypothetical protein
MSTPKRSASLGHSLVFGFLASVGAAAMFAMLTPFVASGVAARAVVAALGLVYVLYLVGRSGERVGRLTTLLAWAVGAALAWLLGLPFAAYTLVHIGLVWLVRSLYYYAGVLPALADLALALAGAALAVFAAQRSGNVWLVFWCFFLVQAFHALIPERIGRLCEPATSPDDAFARARRAAESALRRLSTAR